MNNDIYYRIFKQFDSNGRVEDLAICEMQPHDEFDYSEEKLYVDKKFNSKEDAKQFIDSEIVRLIKMLPYLRKLGILP